MVPEGPRALLMTQGQLETEASGSTVEGQKVEEYYQELRIGPLSDGALGESL